MRRLTFLFYALLAGCISAFAGDWTLDTSNPTEYVLRNEQGKFTGPQRDVLYMSAPTVYARKTFDLTKLPAETRRQFSNARLRLYCAIHDYSWSKGESNGLGEKIIFRVNGRRLIYMTSDPRFPTKLSEKAPMHFRWVDFEFPISWMQGEELVVEFGKLPGSTTDDFFYPAIDRETTNTSSEVSNNGGKTWLRNWSNLDENGEYMLRLVLDRGNADTTQFQHGSDCSLLLDRNIALPLPESLKATGNSVQFPGKAGAALAVPDSMDANITHKGFTLTVVVKFQDKSPQNNHMMLFYKKGSYFLGRTDDRFNFSFCSDGKSWDFALVGGKLPAFDTWVHLAAVVERVDERAQSQIGYRVFIYVNGELHCRKMLYYLDIAHSDSPVIIGEGLPDYDFKGEIASAGWVNRPLSPAEISALAQAEPLVDAVKPGDIRLNDDLEKQFLEALAESRTSEGKWLVNALLRSGRNGFDAKRLAGVLAVTREIVSVQDDLDILAGKFNERQFSFKLAVNPNALLLLQHGDFRRTNPIAGFFDRQGTHEIFAKQTMPWSFQYRDRDGQLKTLNSFDATLNINLKEADTPDSWQATWLGDEFKITSNFKLAGGRLTNDLAIQQLTNDTTLTEVNFPQWHFAKMPAIQDFLLYPRMSGLLQPNPTIEASHDHRYPGAYLTMQFSAYLDQEKNGVYFACEDPMARTKDYSIIGQNNALLSRWRNPVAYPAQGNQPRSWMMSGEAALEIFRGDWFTAAQIYKRFLEAGAQWWISEVPRISTPEWYRNHSLWILAGTSERDLHDLLYFREYFELPTIGSAWAWWYDMTCGDPPEHVLPDNVAQILTRARDAGILGRPYFNSRLWGYNPKPRYLSDWETSTGFLAAVKDISGKPVFEKYPHSSFANMCPAAKISHDWIITECRRLVNFGKGFESIYHDQIPCARPHLCYDPTHGHPLNDPAQWLEKGYWKIYEKIRELEPSIAHDGEDASEAYLKCLDGFTPWRWCEANHVPLFQAIFAPRAQFTGRMFDAHASGGDYASFFPKVAEQLVYGEQIGWFHLNNMRYASPRRTYAKKMAHLRHTLAPFINESEMVAFLEFETPVPDFVSKWANCGYKAQDVTTPSVLHSVWRQFRGQRLMILFVNTTNHAQTVRPILTQSGGNLAICREGEAMAEFRTLGKNPVPPVHLLPYASEVWFIDALDSVIEDTARTLRKIASFTDPGRPLFYACDKRVDNRLSRQPGEWIQAVDSSWLDQCFMPKYQCLGFEKSKRWLQATPGGIADYGTIDFGQQQYSEMEIEVAADLPRAGGIISLVIIAEDGQEHVAAKIQTPVTGDWFDFQTQRTPLLYPISGALRSQLRFSGKGCNIKAWRLVQ